MSELVERVARALASVHGGDPDWTGYQSGPADDARPNWMRHVKEARAAIAAMREPTEAMEHVLTAGVYGYSEAIYAYSEAIDEALK